MTKKSCKAINCPQTRYANTSWCYRHYCERERLKREQGALRKKERYLNSKGYLDHQRKGLKKKLDTAFSLLIRSIGRCERCGRNGTEWRLECSHIYSRSNLATRWDTLNAKSLCHTCHRWWHQHPVEAYEWLCTIRTKEQLDGLSRRSLEIKHWSVTELKDLLADLQQKLSAIK